ncbi:MAG: hypothetical protein LBB43_06365 [Spirochaetaceae bacterium]|jgi:hypothetical protein|nr:hypothetical protein [Spirochaetaceae bacterium]
MKIPAMLLMLLAFSACSLKNTATINREELFRLDIGRMEDQIALYNLEEDAGVFPAQVAMSDGLVYLSDAKGQKMLRYNSYGDLLFMIYNDMTNPAPLTAREKSDTKTITRWSWTYPFIKPGHIAVDDRKHIYIEDRYPIDRYGIDPESNAVLDGVILHFDEEGNFVEYLGQEGLGGRPFPRIVNLYTSINNELAVICYLPTGWNIYWYSPDGLLRYLIKLGSDAVPVTDDRDMVFASLDSFAVAPDARKVYILVNYYRNAFDESTNTKTGTEPDSACIWIMDVETGMYTQTVEVPFYEKTITQNKQRSSEKMFYSLMGAAQSNRLFLSFPEEQGYALMILSLDSYEQKHSFIQVYDDEMQFQVFTVSPEGIISALLLNESIAKIVWWRSDMLFESENIHW